MPTPTVHSNAFNFLSAVQAGVDPRTGQYTCSIALPELKANHLCGPSLPLTLSFSPMSPRDIGFGKGWSLRLSHFDTVSRILSLSTGETFRIEGSISQPTVPERKIDSFHFSFEGSNRYRVVHKSGLVEILTLQGGDTLAWVTEVHSAEGHRLSLAYDTFAGETVLRRLSDDYGTLLDITRLGSAQINVDLHPGQGSEGGPLARFTLVLDNGEVSRVILPSDNQAGWHFTYQWLNEYLCIKELRTPLGGHEYITYDAQGHEFPQSRYPSLPRVLQHAQHPGFGQPPIEVHYRYSSENFLGFNASGLIWDDGLDNLYQADPRYTYNSTEMLWVDGQALRSTLRTFNNFHLLTEETVTQRDNVLSTRTTYHGTPGLPFIQQPPQCQLPREVLKLWYHPSASSQTHEEITRTTFDVFGNLLTQENPDGTLETRRYYPAAGGDGCPADPQGFVRNLQDSTVTPAPGAPGEAPVLRTAHRYALQTGVGGATPGWLAMSDERLLQVNGSTETELQHTAFRYIDQPADRYLHGRKLQETQTLNGCTTILDYTYQRTRNARAGETVQHTTISLSTDFDSVRKTHTLQHSLLHGQPLLNREDNDLEIAYRYDALGRVIEETAAPGTPYEATRHYRYVLSAVDGQQAEQETTDVKGVKTRTLLDGLNRVVTELSQGADENDPARYVQTYKALYDTRGLLIEDTESDWWVDVENGAQLRELPLSSSYEYDDWGEQSSVTGPDRIKRYKVVDPVKNTTTEWQAGMGKTVTVTNLFDKPDSVERLALDGSRISLETTVYDGLGRVCGKLDALNHYCSFGHDAFDRLHIQQLPDKAEIERTYALHSREDLPISISVDNVVLGEQTFDGLKRMTESTVGGRVSRFEYSGGQLQPDKVHTPLGQVIDYLYLPQLGEQPVQRKIVSSTADYTYDPQTARLVSSKEQDQELERDYYSSGEIKEERRRQGGEDYVLQYRYSFKGRLLGYTDVLGQVQTYGYDTSGRLELLHSATLISTFGYNAQGLLNNITTRDNGQSLTIRLEYDDAGREVLRSFTLPGGATQELLQAYDAADHLQQRTLKEDSTVLRDETFVYDSRGRLEVYTASGPEAPLDPQGKQIQSQVFGFDVLDNLLKVETVFAGGSNTALYEYTGLDPTQLSAVRNSHPDYPASIELEYDDNGNLTLDEAGRALEYDALGRLLAVSLNDGSELVGYGYDAQDSLTRSSLAGSPEQRFYREGQLANQLQEGGQRTFLRGADTLLAERRGGINVGTALLATDARNTVLAESEAGSATALDYTAYGYRSDSSQVDSRSAFNGELREPSTGWYLLGQGYRAYNPVLMRFHSPDSLSPFDEGGLNPYAYCLGDPVNYVDPDGHMPKWLMPAIGIGLSIVGIVASVATLGIGTPAAGTGVAAAWGALSVSAKVSVGFGVASGVTGIASGVVSAAAPKSDIGEMLGYVSAALGAVSAIAGLGGYLRSVMNARTAVSPPPSPLPSRSPPTDLASRYPGVSRGPGEYVTVDQLRAAQASREAASKLSTELRSSPAGEAFDLEDVFRRNPQKLRETLQNGRNPIGRKTHTSYKSKTNIAVDPYKLNGS
ncbi:sugar-binding protein [Pseudomonas capsici]|uniref:RHS repeat domain-containing protein n=1 Tax=Pseudomonas capsici TaxID=2810614 RepID=UPI0021F151CA|nr:RHS repeat-associated core domain-containing protein [Pseudomonas capsici]MCV4288011.1 sugar-binding protein [Pseudomonas capsici]